jgi:hypothetical protein
MPNKISNKNNATMLDEKQNRLMQLEKLIYQNNYII